MLKYIIQRILILIPLLLAISVISFIIIQLPPGDYLTMHLMRLKAAGHMIAEEEVVMLTRLYGLDKPLHVQYFIWMRKMLLKGDLGVSFQYNRPVSELIGERIVLTMSITVLTTIFIWIVSVLIGVYSATRQYTIFDYLWTFLSFVGLATPGFLLALVLLWLAFNFFGITALGLFSPEFDGVPWSLAKVWDFLKHVWVPVIIIGIGGSAGLIRVMRATLLDELKKQYVITARAKGLSEGKLLLKYPLRVALNPIISTIGWMLPGLIGGEALVSIVLNIPTCGPLLLSALLNQDMYLAGSFVMILSALAVIGTLISDILLAWLDPRIRYEGVSEK